MVITTHRVDVGDPQIDMNLAKCTCGEKFRSESHSALMNWAHRHVAEMCWVQEPCPHCGELSNHSGSGIGPSCVPVEQW